MNIFGIGLPEMAVIAAIALIVFGPKRLPEMGKTLGRTLKGFQSASQEFEQEFRSALRTGEEETANVPATPPPVLASSSAAPSAENVVKDAQPVVGEDRGVDQVSVGGEEPEGVSPAAPSSTV